MQGRGEAKWVYAAWGDNSLCTQKQPGACCSQTAAMWQQSQQSTNLYLISHTSRGNVGHTCKSCTNMICWVLHTLQNCYSWLCALTVLVLQHSIACMLFCRCTQASHNCGASEIRNTCNRFAWLLQRRSGISTAVVLQTCSAVNEKVDVTALGYIAYIGRIAT